MAKKKAAAPKPERTPTTNRLRELRQKGVVLSLEDVAMLVGLDASTVSRHENGEKGMSKEMILAYAKLYRVPTYEIFLPSPSEEKPVEDKKNAD